MSAIFISYRREDSIATSGRIRDRLVQEFGRGRVFVDVDDIPHGQDFTKILNAKVSECSALLAIIGPKWLDVLDDDGKRRIDAADDFVGIEIAAALARDSIAVIPVLVDGARMPKSSELPERLQSLARRNAIELRNTQFGSDAERLIRSLKPLVRRTSGVSWSKLAAGFGAVAAVLIAALFWKLAGTDAGPSQTVGRIFRDCPGCPEMVVVPAGKFNMGAASHELSIYEGMQSAERPVHEVTLAKPFAVGRFAVTKQQFEEFADATKFAVGGCHYWSDSEVLDPTRSFRDPKLAGGPQTGDHPVVCVRHGDAEKYAAWLSAKTGRSYRLLSDAEHEYVTRAGTSSPFWWGTSISPDQANFVADAPYNGGATAPARRTTVPVKFFEPNPWGLYQMHGNVTEWVADCWHPTLAGAPNDGSAWNSNSGVCAEYTVRGGSFVNRADLLRSAHRRLGADIAEVSVGFRVAQTLAR